MNRINKKFSQIFGGHWIKVKFYSRKPNIRDGEKLEGVRFCDATKKAIMRPIILDNESISCNGARYAFGWSSDYKDLLSQDCLDKNQVQSEVLESMLSKIHRFKKPFQYIGLNTEGAPDLIMSYMQPEGIMKIIKIYNYYSGENLDMSLCSMMSICSGIAVKTYLEDKISLSFGCDDSRKFADIGRNNLAVGVPNILLKQLIR
ncbi:MAG: DUF169 domain-containing protein [Deltaproteobacteria bacterium]|nr:DUF169 domain-containing protein [Deltaproteobacteria bacterium]